MALGSSLQRFPCPWHPAMEGNAGAGIHEEWGLPVCRGEGAGASGVGQGQEVPPPPWALCLSHVTNVLWFWGVLLIAGPAICIWVLPRSWCLANAGEFPRPCRPILYRREQCLGSFLSPSLSPMALSSLPPSRRALFASLSCSRMPGAAQSRGWPWADAA